MPKSTPSEQANIIQAGILAPSADNHLCFVFAADAGSIRLFGRPAYFCAPFHKNVLNRISLGAVVENMVIRAAKLGFRAEPEWISDPGRPALLAELHLTHDEPADAVLDDAIAARHTNRRVAYSGPPLGEAELAAFVSLIDDIPGVSLQFVDAGRPRRALLHLVRLAEAERFKVRALHEDLFSAVRFELGWKVSAQQGLPPAVLGVEPGMRWAFAQLRHWPVMSVLGRVGMHHALGFRAAYLPCRLAPHRGVLTTRLPLEQGTVEVGRALQRVWLEAQRRGQAFQPLAGAALLALPCYQAVRAATGERLRQGWKSLTDETPLMVFRMGRAKPPEVRTGRPRWEDFVAT